MIRFVLLLVIILCSPTLSAQSWQELYDQTETCWGKDWEACKQILEKARLQAIEEFGESDSVYLLTINDLGLCYLELSEYDPAKRYLLEALEKTEQAYGKDHNSYWDILINLGSLHTEIGQYQTALSYFQTSKASMETHLGKQHPRYTSTLNNLANLNFKMGHWEKAISLFQEVLTNTERTLGKTHLRYGLSLNNLGHVYTGIGDFESALSALTEALAITEAALGKQHPTYGTLLNSMASLYLEMGEHKAALPVLQEVLQNIEQHFGTRHYQYATALSNLARVYTSMGKWEDAESFYQQSIQLTADILGEEHDSYGGRLGGLAIVYSATGRYDDALALYQKALQNEEKNLGKQHPGRISTLHNMAILYRKMGKYDTALPLMKESLNNTEQILGKQHHLYGFRLQGLGYVYKMLGQYENALAAYSESLTIIESSLGKLHQWYENQLTSLASLYIAMGKDDIAFQYYQELLQVISLQLASQFDALNAPLQSSYLDLKKISLEHMSVFIMDQAENRQVHAMGLDQTLLLKGFLQNQRIDLLQGLRQHPDTSVQQEFKEWERLHRILARQYQKAREDRLASFDSLRILADELEIHLANQSVAFRNARKQVRWPELQSALSPEEAVVEFSHLAYRNAEGKRAVRYVAYVLTATDSLPLMIPLCEEQELMSLLSAEGPQQNMDQLYALRGIKPKKNSTQPSKNIGEVLWQPIEPYLSEIKTIYVSPSGLLHKMNLGAMSLKQSELVSDRYQLIQLGSSRSLVYEQAQSDQTFHQDALLLGGIQYDQLKPVVPQVVDTASHMPGTGKSDLGAVNISSTKDGESWQYLPGTAKEIQAISELLNKKGYAVSLKTGKAAREETILTQSKSPRILHIATHGYFFPDRKDSIQTELIDQSSLVPIQLSDHPMVRSGLILAGANHAWAGNPVPEGQEDGILTAYEISQMDLSHTELVVLSACETGLGDIQGSEGVYGLQRAFKIAGVKYILMSLWQVPDQATQELMTAFYEKWLGGMEIRAALQAAQKQVTKKYQEPYYWAGFVLVE